jgi:hypothetical protein
MKTFKIAAALVAASTSAFTIAPAFAQGHPAGQGHYEWRQAAQYGPRAPLQAPKRVWVSDGAQVADCDCGMMKMSSADAATCMKGMPGMAPSGASAG